MAVKPLVVQNEIDVGEVDIAGSIGTAGGNGVNSKLRG